MNGDTSTSERAADWLRHLGLDTVAASFLEAFRSLLHIGAQALYIVEPLFGGMNDPVQDVARMLDDPDQVDDLIARLRMESDE